MNEHMFVHHRAPHQACERCGEEHVLAELPPDLYSYTLALYLGDGWLYRQQNGAHTLALSMDAAYPGIIAEARTAISAVSGRQAWATRRPGTNWFQVGITWRPWPCLIPQHGPGRKHLRRIRLEPWQWMIVREWPKPFLRGLIQTDGWRGLNRVHVKGRDYAYPRYQFSSRSDDIRRLFTDVCDLIGVEWRPWGRWHMSVARRHSVAILDEFIGPKR